jgi:hypothetical protein
MKTPVSLVAKAIGLWAAVMLLTQTPLFIENYNARLALMTIVMPNVLRLIVGNIPQLAVDQKFMFIASIFSFLLAFAFGRVSKKSQETVTEYGKDTKKTLQGSALFVTTFTLGALITYYSGIHKTLYTQMGWETANNAAATQPMASAMNVVNY